MPDFFQLEGEGPVYQFDSAVQETTKLLMMIGNAVHHIHLFISLERVITSSYCSLTSYDWPLACSPISTDLEISNKSSMRPPEGQAHMLGGFGGFGRTTHSLVEIHVGACVCMVLGHLAWP